MKRRFAQAAMAVSLATAMLVSSVPIHALADGNYGDMIEVDFPDVYPESALENISSTEIKTKVDALLKTMTEDEIYGMLGGASSSASAKGYGTGYSAGVARLGVPILRMWDGPKGVISNGSLETTSPASELALAASFSEDMAYDYGKMTGLDNKATAGNVQLGVQLDHVRAPFFQRSRDSMGEDPYLTSKLGLALSEGVQDQHVMTTLKHLAVYSNMFAMPMMTGKGDDIQIDEQTLHEMYLAPYEYIIKNKGASAVMTSYNAVNGEMTSANSYLQKTVLRDMWGFTGMTMADWGGNVKLSTHLGKDFEMPTINKNNKESIEAAIAEGTMTYDDVLTAVRHTLTAYGEIGYLGLVTVKQDGTAAADPDAPDTIELNALEGEERVALLEENDTVALESAVKGSVLLKNDNEALPVDKDDSIAMIGLLADHTLNHISESSYGWLQKMTGAYTEIKKILGEDANITEAVGLDTLGETVSANYLYTTEDCTTNGVNISIDGEDARTIDTVRLTTGTIGGETNRTYKNSANGTALVNGQKAEVTAYLKAPATGTYELEMLKIGGTVQANIVVGETEISISGSTAQSSGGFGGGGSTTWPSTGAIPTDEGMDVPKTTTSVDLVEGNVYKITVTAEANTEAKDLQFSLNWFKPSDRTAQYQAAIDAAKTHKKVIYFAYDKGESSAGGMSFGRGSLDLAQDQLDLMQDVIVAAKENGNQVIIVLNAALPVKMDWLNDVDAVLEMWLSGQSGGKAAALLLTGEENPSGKLPVTFPKSENDTQHGEFVTGYVPEKVNNIDPEKGGEGIFSGYRWYDKADIEPLFEFGYGLSYTDFAYSDLSIEKLEDGYNVTFTVTNIGDVTGSEIAQVYLGAANVPEDVQMAEYRLAAFARVEDLAPGASVTVTTKVEGRELCYWDTDMDVEEGTEKWVVAEGERTFYVGASSDDLLLSENVNVKDIKLTATSKPSNPDNDNDELEKAAVEAAQKAAEAAQKAAEAAEAAQRAAEAAQAAAENQAAMTEITSQAQAAAQAAVQAAAAAEKASVEAAASTENQKNLLSAAETAQKAAELAKEAAETALKLVQQQNNAAEAAAKAAEESKEAAQAAQAAAETQTTEAVAQAQAAQKLAEAAKEAAETQAAQAAATGATIKAAAEAAAKAAEAAVEAVEKQNSDALLQAADAQVKAELAVQDAKDAVADFEKQTEEILSKVADAEIKADQAMQLAEAAKTAAEAAQKAAEAAQKEAEAVRQEAAGIKADAEKQTAAAKAEAEAAKREAADAKEVLQVLMDKFTFSAKDVDIKNVKSTNRKKATVTWKKVSGADGYVVQYSVKSGMKNAKKVVISKGSTTKKVLKKLKSKKIYYVRVRAYKNINGTKIYTAYSAVDQVKVK